MEHVLAYLPKRNGESTLRVLAPRQELSCFVTPSSRRTCFAGSHKLPDDCLCGYTLPPLLSPFRGNQKIEHLVSEGSFFAQAADCEGLGGKRQGNCKATYIVYTLALNALEKLQVSLSEIKFEDGCYWNFLTNSIEWYRFRACRPVEPALMVHQSCCERLL